MGGGHVRHTLGQGDRVRRIIRACRGTGKEERIMSIALNRLGAVQAAHKLQRRELTAVQLVRACFARIEQRESTVHAWTALQKQAALDQAEALDKGALRGKQAPTALFCSNDLLATAVIADLVGLGLSVPADISVCGFDGMRFGALLTPPLTTVAQPSDGIGQTACSNLLAQIHGQPPQSNRLPHCIVVGGTAASVRR
jgi:DNA-binding LacI/PurR family transcriptional regulator